MIVFLFLTLFLLGLHGLAPENVTWSSGEGDVVLIALLEIWNGEGSGGTWVWNSDWGWRGVLGAYCGRCSRRSLVVHPLSMCDGRVWVDIGRSVVFLGCEKC